MVAAKGLLAVKTSKDLAQRGQDFDLANANAMEADVFGFLCATLACSGEAEGGMLPGAVGKRGIAPRYTLLQALIKLRAVCTSVFDLKIIWSDPASLPGAKS